MSGWEDARRILVVQLDGLGDLLMSTPALRALRDAGPPHREITLLAPAETGALAPYLDVVDEVIVYDPPWTRARGADPSATQDLFMIGHLHARCFDAAVIFASYGQASLPAAFLCHLAGIPLRLARCGEDPSLLLTDWVRETESGTPLLHEVRRRLEFVAAAGATPDDGPLRVSLPDDAAGRARALLEQAEVRLDEPWIVAHPGAAAPARRFPSWSFAEVLQRLVHEDGLQVVITGGHDDRELAADLAEHAGDGAVSLAGRTTLELLGGVLGQTRLLLSSSAWPVHLAAALGVPVVDLYALTRPQRTPWLVPTRVISHDVPCRWCYASECPLGHHLCVRGVEPSEVVEAVRELLGDSDARAAGAPG